MNSWNLTLSPTARQLESNYQPIIPANLNTVMAGRVCPQCSCDDCMCSADASAAVSIDTQVRGSSWIGCMNLFYTWQKNTLNSHHPQN